MSTAQTTPHLTLHSVVNLNDWRARVRGDLRRRLGLALLGIGAVILAVTVLLRVWLGAQHVQTRQEQQQIAAQRQLLAPGLATYRNVQSDLAIWRAVPAMTQSAHASRGRIRDLLLDLSAHVAAGVAIESIRMDGDLIDVRGSAPSKAAAVDFVRALKTRGWPANPPSVTQAAGNERAFQFLIKPKARKAK